MKFKFYGVLFFLLTAKVLHAAPITTVNTESLTGIEIVGNQRQSKEGILFKAGFQEGDDLNNIDLTEVLNKLWATDLYDDIKIEVISKDSGKKIILKIQERPVIKKVSYVGGKRIGVAVIKSKIKESKLDINPGSTYSLESIRKIKNLIVDLALNKGFANPTINVTIEPIDHMTHQLVFDIKEGSRVKLQKIIFQGNKVISSDVLKSVMNKSLLARLTGSNEVLIQNNINRDIENIKHEYWKRGYKDVAIGKPIISTPTLLASKKKGGMGSTNLKKDHLRQTQNAEITIPISEGEYFSKGEFKTEGDDKDLNIQKIKNLYESKTIKHQATNRTETMSILKLKRPAEDASSKDLRPFNMHAINNVIDGIRTNYNDQGYVNCNIQQELKVTDGPDGKTVDTIVNIDKGEQFTVRRINFEGNIKTKDKVLRRSMIIDEGDALNVGKLRDSLTRLSQLGYFNIRQDPKLEPIANTSVVDITINGKESDTNTLMFKLGYGSTHHLGVGGSVFTDNLNGKGQSLGINLNTDPSNRVASINYTEPFLFDTPYSVTTNIFSDSSNLKRTAEDPVQRSHHGIGFSGGTKLSTYLPNYNWAYFASCSTGYQFRFVKNNDNSSQYTQNNNRWLKTSSLNQSLTYSTINHPFRPTNGQSSGIHFECGGWQLSKDTPYLKTSVDYKKLVKITNDSTFYFYANCGYIKSKKSREGHYNLVDLYKTGGENSVRGFDENCVGPSTETIKTDQKTEKRSTIHRFIGGNRQLVVNLEYQFRLSDVVQSVLFYDLGQVWAGRGRNSNKELVRGTPVDQRGPCSSVGVELRLFITSFSPAPIRLIWARRIKQYSFDKKLGTQFQFTIGTNF